MAKIDWASIEGYTEDLTAEQKLALLEQYELPEAERPAAPADMISKKQFDKVSSELAAAKRQLRNRMTEDEQRAAEQAEAQEAMRLELEELRRGAKMSQYKAQHLALGYDEATANDAAEALTSGDMECYFMIAQRQKLAAEKAMRAKILKDTPVPPAGDESNEQLQKDKELAQLRKWMGLN